MAETQFEQSGLVAGSRNSGHALIDNGRFAFILGLAVDVMMFGGLLGAYFVLRGTATLWPPPALPQLTPVLVGLSGGCLIASAVFMSITVRAQYQNNLSGMRLSLAAAVVMIATFLAINAIEWSHLLSNEATLRSVFGGIYFMITGIFHAHIVVGLAFGASKLRRILHWRRYTRSTNSLVHLSYFFYAMSLVWFAIFSVVYIN